MRVNAIRLLVLLLPLLAACGGNHQAITSGPIQKRHFRGGWHVDFRHQRRDHASVHSRRELPVRVQPQQAEISARLPETTPAEMGHPPVPFARVVPEHLNFFPSVNQEPTFEASRPRPFLTDPSPSDDQGFNTLGVIALAIVIALPVLGIALQSSLIAVGGAAIGFGLGLFAAKRGRNLALRGNGFAMAAMILGAVLLLLSVIGLAR